MDVNGENIYVETDYQNIILIDPNKIVDNNGNIQNRLVNHENLIMYANLTCNLLPRTRLLVGAGNEAPVQYGEIQLAQINFLSEGTDSNQNPIPFDTKYADEQTGKNSLQGGGLNQNVSAMGTTTVNGQQQSYNYQDTQNLQNTGLLGITSISIKNSSSFVPTVNIELEDVRGRALFERGDKSPYAAFFWIPYPLFYLTIKGYYGKAIRYALMLYTFNARFNTMTGNYQISLVFQAYRYGALIDVMMGHLFALPHMYEKTYSVTPKTINSSTGAQQGTTTNTVQTQTTLGEETLSNVYDDYISRNLIDRNFPKLNMMELINNLTQLETNIKASLGQQDISCLTDVDNYLNNLNNYSQDVTSPDRTVGWLGKYLDPSKNIITTDNVTLYRFYDSISSDAGQTIQAVTALNNIVTNYSKILDANKTLGVNGKIPATTNTSNITSITNLLKNPKMFNFPLGQKITINYAATYYSRYNKPPTTDQLNAFTQSVQAEFSQFKSGYYFFNGTIGNSVKSFLTLKGDMVSNLNLSQQTIKSWLSTKLKNKLDDKNNGLGFRPTIRNITAVIVANAEAFLRLLNNVHEKAWALQNDSNRTKILTMNSVKSVDNRNTTAAYASNPNNSNTNTKPTPIYPWPQVFKEKINKSGNSTYEEKYPGDLDIKNLIKGDDYTIWPEVEFVEEFEKAFIERDSPVRVATNINQTITAIEVPVSAIEFPLLDHAYVSKQNVNFVYEMWERFIVATEYGRFQKSTSNIEIVSNFISNNEILNFTNTITPQNVSLQQFLMTESLTPSSQIDTTLSTISNHGTGPSYQLYERKQFVTPYIQNETSNPFIIFGDEYYEQPLTNIATNINNNSLIQFTGYTLSPASQGTNDFDSYDLYPYVIPLWGQNNLANYSNVSLNNVNKVIVYNNKKKLFANYQDNGDPAVSRPYTNYLQNNNTNPVPTTSTIASFYQSRSTSSFGQNFFTEGQISYKNYQGSVGSNQTTSLLNTPYFVNAIQLGISNSGLTYPYVEAAYLFINSLPLATLKEKYISQDTSRIDLDYVMFCFKKYGAIHKIPYAWVLKYGSIWHRYKTWINNGFDFLAPVWTNFNYISNWNPISGTTKTSYNVNGQTITLESGQNNVTVGFYPKVINDFNIFFLGYPLFSTYSDQEISSAVTDGHLSIITANNTQNININQVSAYINLNDSSNDIIILPSFGSNYNQINNELTTSLADNSLLFDGSVRTAWGLPNFGYFNNASIDMPSPLQYIKQIYSSSADQPAFTLGASSLYSSIEEIFSIFDENALDQMESQFLNWSRSMYNSNFEIVTQPGQIDSSVSVDLALSISNSEYKNFQKLFIDLMTISGISNTNSSTIISEIQQNQIDNFNEVLYGFLNYDVVIKNGNPSFYDRRLFYSMANGLNGLSITAPIIFDSYKAKTPNTLPSLSSGITLALSKAKYSKEWRTLLTYVGFSSINGISYSDKGSFITDFFIDNDISFTVSNIQMCAPLIKMYATQKYQGGILGGFKNLIATLLNNSLKLRQTSFDNFMKMVLNQMPNSISNVAPVNRQAPLNSNQNKTEDYATFKALNDKWIAGFDFTTSTLFEDILFLDRASRDIGNDVYVDIHKLKNLLSNINMDANVMFYLMSYIQENHFVIMNVPSYVNFYNVQSLSNQNTTPTIESTTQSANNMFGTHTNVDIRNSSPKLVCFYVDKASEFLQMDNPNFGWNTDSFDLSQTQNPLVENQVGKTDWAISNKIVGFNVDVGLQNQNMFSNIILSQDNGKATSESLAMLNQMGNSASGKKTGMQNQSLFNQYKVRSYTCTVESLGNAMIQPTMYFNLRHVPMFAGSYMILSVEHTIQPGIFKTVFSGIRQSFFSLPTIDDFLGTIFQNYLTELLTEIQQSITQSLLPSSNIYAQNANALTDLSKKKSSLQDCSSQLVAPYTTYTLSSVGTTTLSVDDLKDILNTEVPKDRRTRFIIYSIIHIISYNSDAGNYITLGNNYALIKLNASAYTALLNKYGNGMYICSEVPNSQDPATIFPIAAFDDPSDCIDLIRDNVNMKSDILGTDETQWIKLMTQFYFNNWIGFSSPSPDLTSLVNGSITQAYHLFS